MASGSFLALAAVGLGYTLEGLVNVLTATLPGGLAAVLTVNSLAHVCSFHGVTSIGLGYRSPAYAALANG